MDPSLGFSLIYHRVKTPTVINTFGFSFNLFLGNGNSYACLNELNLPGGSPKVQLPVIEGSGKSHPGCILRARFGSGPQDSRSILKSERGASGSGRT